MVEPLRHRQTKEAETDMSDLQPPRHISTLPFAFNFSLGPDVSFRDQGEVDGAAEFAVSVANDPGCVKTQLVI